MSEGTFFCKNCQQETTINDDYSEGMLKYYICRKWKYKNNKWSFEHKIHYLDEWKWPWCCDKCNHKENDFAYFVKDNYCLFF